MSLTLYRVFVSATVLYLLMVVTTPILMPEQDRGMWLFMLVGSTASIFGSVVLTVRRQQMLKPGSSAWPWWAVGGVLLLVSGVLAVLIRLIFG